jgi:hypothetical protein
MKIRRLVLGAATMALVGAGAIALPASAQTSDVALDAIDELVHDVSDGVLDAEDALEQIEVIIHEIPASERSVELAVIDDVVHHWEDGEVEADAAIEEIADILHGGSHVHGDAGTPAPAVTGMGDASATGSSAAMVVALFALTLALVSGARMLRLPARG